MCIHVLVFEFIYHLYSYFIFNIFTFILITSGGASAFAPTFHLLFVKKCVFISIFCICASIYIFTYIRPNNAVTTALAQKKQKPSILNL